MNTLFRLMMELMGRYVVAASVGILFLLFNGLIVSHFMSHLGMAGNTITFFIGTLMLFEVPLWMLCVKIVGVWHRSVWIEIIIAGIIAVCAAQIGVFERYFWPNYLSPTVDPDTKQQMLFWFVYTVVNYLLAIHTAALYCWLAWVIRKRRTPSAEGAI